MTDVGHACGAGTGCGGCRPEIARLIEDDFAATGHAASAHAASAHAASGHPPSPYHRLPILQAG